MEPDVLRALERILVVLFGGLSIFLGYRLFVLIPSPGESEGKVVLPGGVSIFVSRVGPGVFFALFGALVIALSLYEPVIYHRERAVTGGEATIGTRSDTAHYTGAVRADEPGSPANPASAWDSLQLSLELEFLNALPDLMRTDITPSEGRSAQARIERTKLVLMHYAWEPGWGRFDDFRHWVGEGARDPVPDTLVLPAEYFRAGGAGAMQ